MKKIKTKKKPVKKKVLSAVEISMKKKKKTLSALEKLQYLQGLDSKPLERWLTTKKSHSIKHLPDIEDLINQIFNDCADLLEKIKTEPEKIYCILGCPQKNKWTTFLDNLSISDDQNTMTTYLFQTLVQEFLLNEKDYKPFWTDAFKELSEKLSSPIETGLVDLHLTSSKALSLKQVEKLPFLKRQKINLQNKNSQMTYCPSYTSSVADKWEKENIKKPLNFKTLVVKLQLTQRQKKIYKEHYGCFRYVHNKTLYHIKNLDEKKHLYNIRNKLVTKNTKLNSEVSKSFKEKLALEYSILNEMQSRKDPFIKKQQQIIKDLKLQEKEELKNVKYEPNTELKEWEKKYHKDLRTNAVKKVINSYKTAESNFRAGNIKSYNIGYMKLKNPRQCIELSEKQVFFRNNCISLPSFKKTDSSFKISKKTLKKIKSIDNFNISHNCDFVKQKNSYYLHIPIKIFPSETNNINTNSNTTRCCGVDPGIVKIATTFSNNGVSEYSHNRELLKRYNEKINFLKNKRKRIRKKQINKVEKKKIDYTDRLHWGLIKSLLDNNDVVFFGDIKSHDIVKDSKYKKVNLEFNDLKFYTLKQRMIYKAKTRGKKVILVNERYTSLTCSTCGTREKPDDRIYKCQGCEGMYDRDINSAKNILMRGILDL